MTGINKYYGTNRVLKDVDLTIEDGEFMTLLGPSGCGKTTTLRVIAGLEKPQSGSIVMDGKRIVNAAESFFAPPAKRGLNLVFQSYALWPHMTVFDNVAFGLRVKHTPKDEIKKLVENALSRMQIGEYAGRYPSELSGGQQQRVAIARAIATPVELLLLDEPLSNLDAKLRVDMRSELKRLHEEMGTTIIYVTHDQSEALSVSDHIAVMNAGHVLQVGTPFEIYESPATQFVAEFIGETNLFEAQVVDCVPHQTPGKDPDYMVTCSVPALGHQAPLASDTEATASLDRYMQVTDYGPTQKGQKVAFTIRPEKIRITKEPPETHGRTDINVFKGIVEEPVYSGFQSKFYVRLENGALVKVFKQHTIYFDDGPAIQWKDDVYISWAAEDGYIVEDIQK